MPFSEICKNVSGRKIALLGAACVTAGLPWTIASAEPAVWRAAPDGSVYFLHDAGESQSALTRCWPLKSGYDCLYIYKDILSSNGDADYVIGRRHETALFSRPDDQGHVTNGYICQFFGPDYRPADHITPIETAVDVPKPRYLAKGANGERFWSAAAYAWVKRFRYKHMDDIYFDCRRWAEIVLSNDLQHVATLPLSVTEGKIASP